MFTRLVPPFAASLRALSSLASCRLLCCALAVGLPAACAFGFEITAPRFEQGGLVLGQAAPGEQVFYQGKALQQGPNGEFALGLGRDAPADIQLESVVKGQKTVHRFKVRQRQYAVQRITGVPEKMVTPPKALSDRIAREAALVNKARSQRLARLDFVGPFIWPAKGPITGVYGSQRIYNNTPKNPHFGIDIAGPAGAEVRSPAAGRVILAEPDLYFSGGTVIVDHGHGISSTLMHLSRVDVALGDELAQGDLIGGIGSTGRSTGPHLDWRMNWHNERIDPALLFAPGDLPPKS
jgi:murein DD-endopeptidase MepM/ murein hydrolase activator NlpD